jgi:HK97 family phage major capsid protein
LEVLVAYNNLTSRTDAGALIPEEVSRDMIRRATDDSATLQLFRRVPVGRAQVRFPVLSALPVAYFVNGDTGLKQTTEVNWTNKYLNIEEIAAIVPVPDNVVADVELDIWDEMMPYLVEAFYRTFDAAVFFGTNAPGTWPTNVAAAATAAGNNNTEGNTAAQGGFFGDYDETLALVEADGFDPTAVVANRTARAQIRAARDSTGQVIDGGRIAGGLNQIDDLPIVYPMRGLWPTGSGAPRLFVGDWSQFVVGVRQDITMKILTEAVIQDNTGQIIYNLAQQDMTALRLTFRVGWQVSNLINYDQPTEGSRYPVARLNLA